MKRKEGRKEHEKNTPATPLYLRAPDPDHKTGDARSQGSPTRRSAPFSEGGFAGGAFRLFA